MRGFRSGWFFFLVIIAHSCVATEGLSSLEFDELLEEIHQANRWDVSPFMEAAPQARDFVLRHPSTGNEIRLAAALAPSRFLRKGYRPVRHELAQMLGNAQKSGQSATLVPELRFALSDLALRNGEIRFSLRQLVSAFTWVNDSTPDVLKQRLMAQLCQIHLMAGNPLDTLRVLSQLAPGPNPGNFNERISRELLKAEALGDARQYGAMNLVLDEVLLSLEDQPDSPFMPVFWMLKAWHALHDTSLGQARKFVNAAGQAAGRGTSEFAVVEGDIRFLEALISFLDGDAAGARVLLEAAISSHSAAACPSRSTHQLIKASELPMADRILQANSPFLESLAAYAHIDNNLRAHFKGLAAWAEQMRFSGDGSLDQVTDAYRNSLFFQEHFTRILGELNIQLAQRFPVKSESTGEFRAGGSSFYLFFLLLVSLVLVLVLALRMHTQMHVHLQLKHAIEQARIAEEATAESNRMKSQFLANVSHEIKTPMSGLVGMASLLDELISEPEQKRYLETIRTCSENLLVLMNDLLDLGRMESKHFHIEHSSFNPRKVTGYCLEMIRSSAHEKGLEICEEIHRNVPESLIGDGTRIGQILTNLLHNAIKFTDAGRITLDVGFESTLGSSGTLLITVSDTGIGIPKEIIPTVFEPFSQVKLKREKKYTGSGLGLAICKKLAELMGGSIGVESVEGKGSIFNVQIPVQL